MKVSRAFTVEDLALPDPPVEKSELWDLGYEITSRPNRGSRWYIIPRIFDRGFLEISDRNRFHDRLRVLQILRHTLIAPLTFNRFLPRGLEHEALGTYAIPASGEPSVNTKLVEFLSSGNT